MNIFGRKKGFGDSSFNRLYQRYVSSAKKRKIKWNISKDDFAKITKHDCYLCGVEPRLKEERDDAYGFYLYNGLDRIDSSLGYTLDNVKACCWTCNNIKAQTPLNDLFLHLKKMLRHFWKY